MYYIYFPYIVILALLMSYECNNKMQPRWWVLMVLFAPITMPYFIFKSRKEAGISFFMIFLMTFSAVAGLEAFLYSKYYEKNKYSHLPALTIQLIRHAEDLKVSTTKLDHALVKLENLSKVESRIHEIKRTIEFIDQLRDVMFKNQEDINRLVKYTSDYTDFFAGRDLEWVFDIQFFYNNRVVIQHNKSIQNYLERFEDLLRYTHRNFYNITEHKTKDSLKNYDEYYIRYRRAVDSHNRFNVKRIDFQNKYLQKHPDIKAYLPGKRQTETFKLWE
ncbi:MAG: hypothetical protein GY699_22185 [Desulfobacteraceae bacterium]|nr:hypothetical protein [Desulfobacteraceae bacterium]